MYKRVEMSLAEIYESSREICHFDLQKDPEGLTDDFYSCERVEKTLWSCNLFTFKTYTLALKMASLVKKIVKIKDGEKCL